MAEINQENGVFGGVSFGNEVNENAVVENAGTIRNEALPAKVGFWQKFKSFWLQDIDWNKEIKVEVKNFRPSLRTIKEIYAVGIPSIIMASIGSVMTFGLEKVGKMT